jgi:hypothetical protein
MGFVVDKVALGQVFSENFGSLANSHSTDRSTLIIIYHPGRVKIGQVMAQVPNGLVSPQPKKQKKKKHAELRCRSLHVLSCKSVFSEKAVLLSSSIIQSLNS